MSADDDANPLVLASCSKEWAVKVWSPDVDDGGSWTSPHALTAVLDDDDDDDGGNNHTVFLTEQFSTTDCVFGSTYECLNTGDMRVWSGCRGSFECPDDPDDDVVCSSIANMESVCECGCEGSRAHSSTVFSLSFSPDGAILASGSFDKTVKLWSVDDDYSLLQTLEGHTGKVWSVCFSPDDGGALASASDDKLIKLWTTPPDASSSSVNYTLAAELNGHAGSVRTLAFAPDGKILASGSSDSVVMLWNVTAGYAHITSLIGHSDTVRTLAFSKPNGRFLASGSFDSTIKIWAVAICECYELASEGVNDASLGDGWSLTDRTDFPEYGFVHGKCAGCDNAEGLFAFFSADDEPSKTWTGLSAHTEVSISARVWVQGVPEPNELVRFSVDGDMKWTSAAAPLFGQANCASQWDEWDSSIFNDKWCTADNSTTTSASCYADVQLSSVDHSADNLTVKFTSSLDSGCEDKSFGFSDFSLSFCSESCLVQTLTDHTNTIASLAYSPDGTTLASASIDERIRIWDVESTDGVHVLAQTISELFDDGHGDGVSALSFSPDGAILASADLDDNIKFWNTDTSSGNYELIETLKGAHGNDVNSVAFSPRRVSTEPYPATPVPTSAAPSNGPSAVPSGVPTPVPSASPSGSPTSRPTAAPSVAPSAAPTADHCKNGAIDNDETDVDCGGAECNPCALSQKCEDDSHCEGNLVCAQLVCATQAPSPAPSPVPSQAPSLAPSPVPSDGPSAAPSGVPTPVPSASPSGLPTSRPTVTPSGAPSAAPTADHCRNGIIDNGETDVDCGGAECNPCALSQKCEDDSHCTGDLVCDTVLSAEVKLSPRDIFGNNNSSMDCNPDEYELLHCAGGNLEYLSGCTTMDCDYSADAACVFVSLTSFMGGCFEYAPSSFGIFECQDSELIFADYGSDGQCASGSKTGDDPGTFNNPPSCKSECWSTTDELLCATIAPSAAPSPAPSHSPTSLPSSAPSPAPSSVPSVPPTAAPSEGPSAVPSSAPSSAPSYAPTAVPWFVSTFDPPILSAEGGEILVIGLSNYTKDASVPDTSTTVITAVTIGDDYSCETPQFTDATGVWINCTQPAGVGANHVVTVFFSDMAAALSVDGDGVSYAAPSVESVSPNGCGTAGEEVLTITGANFGGLDFGPTVTVGDKVCTNPRWTSDSELNCTIPAGTGADLEVIVAVGGQSSSGKGNKNVSMDGTVMFSFDRPILIQTDRFTYDTMGEHLVTISGDNFGPPAGEKIGVEVNDTGRVLPIVAFSLLSASDMMPPSAVMCGYVHHTHTEIVCDPPSGVGFNYTITVEVDGQQSASSSLFFHYSPPTIATIQRLIEIDGDGDSAFSLSDDGGDEIYIIGDNFGNGEGFGGLLVAEEWIEVTIGGVPCTEVSVINAEKLRGLTPACPGSLSKCSSLNVTVTIAGQTSASTEGVGLFSYSSWTGSSSILRLSPTSGTAAGGTTLTVNANSLKDDPDAQITCQFADENNNVVISDAAVFLSENNVTCVTPAWSFAAASTAVTVKAGDISLVGLLEYNFTAAWFPDMVSESDTSGPATGEQTILIDAAGLDASEGAQYVCRFDSLLTAFSMNTTVDDIDHDEIHCTTPAWGTHHAASNAIVTVLEDGRELTQSSTNDHASSVLIYSFVPALVALEPSTVESRGGEELTVTASGLDSSAEYSCKLDAGGGVYSLSAWAIAAGPNLLQCRAPRWLHGTPTDAVVTLIARDSGAEIGALGITITKSLHVEDPIIAYLGPLVCIGIAGVIIWSIHRRFKGKLERRFMLLLQKEVMWVVLGLAWETIDILSDYFAWHQVIFVGNVVISLSFVQLVVYSTFFWLSLTLSAVNFAIRSRTMFYLWRGGTFARRIVAAHNGKSVLMRRQSTRTRASTEISHELHRSQRLLGRIRMSLALTLTEDFGLLGFNIYILFVLLAKAAGGGGEQDDEENGDGVLWTLQVLMASVMVGILACGFKISKVQELVATVEKVRHLKNEAKANRRRDSPGQESQAKRVQKLPRFSIFQRKVDDVAMLNIHQSARPHVQKLKMHLTQRDDEIKVLKRRLLVARQNALAVPKMATRARLSLSKKSHDVQVATRRVMRNARAQAEPKNEPKKEPEEGKLPAILESTIAAESLSRPGPHRNNAKNVVVPAAGQQQQGRGVQFLPRWAEGRGGGNVVRLSALPRPLLQTDTGLVRGLKFCNEEAERSTRRETDALKGAASAALRARLRAKKKKKVRATTAAPGGGGSGGGGGKKSSGGGQPSRRRRRLSSIEL